MSNVRHIEERRQAAEPRRGLARLRRIARSAIRSRAARFLSEQPVFLDTGPVRLGQHVVGWQEVQWEGANQAHGGSFFHGSITVGFGTHFGANSYVTGDVSVGRYGSFGAQAALISHDRHPIETAAMYVSSPLLRPARAEGEGWMTVGQLRVGHDVWIGHGASVLGAVTVGNGAVIGANSVVSADVPPFTIVAGSPAKVIRTRFQPEIIELLQQFAWWDLDSDELAANGPVLDVDLTVDPQRSIELLREAISARESR